MLKFVKTLTVAEFKKQNDVDAIEIVKSPKSGKLFFTTGTIKGAVTTDNFDDVRMSLVSGDEGEFWMLHKHSGNHVVAVL